MTHLWLGVNELAAPEQRTWLKLRQYFDSICLCTYGISKECIDVFACKSSLVLNDFREVQAYQTIQDGRRYIVKCRCHHYSDVIKSAMASQITSISTDCSAVYSCAHQRKNQSSALLAFVWGIHRWPVDSLYKGPVTRKIFHLTRSSLFQNVCTSTKPKTYNLYARLF